MRFAHWFAILMIVGALGSLAFQIARQLWLEHSARR